MASLFALGVMSIAWMAVVAALIAVEKLLPWRRVATYGTAGILLALGVLLLAAPDAVPALSIPRATACRRCRQWGERTGFAESAKPTGSLSSDSALSSRLSSSQSLWVALRISPLLAPCVVPAC